MPNNHKIFNLAANARFQVEDVLLYTPTVTEVHSDASQMTKMELYEEIVNETEYN